MLKMESSGLPLENNRSLVELPRDVSLNILRRLDQVEILESAQFVCKPWYDICKDPSLWRCIRFKDLEDLEIYRLNLLFKEEPKREPKRVFNHEKMVFNAIDRSAGGLIDLDIEGFLPDGICSYVASRSTQVKRLRFVHCCIPFKDLVEALEKQSSLDELELTLCSFDNDSSDMFSPRKFISVINSCPLSLTTLKLNERGSRTPYRSSDMVALTIAGRFPQLHHLQFIGHDITTVGLTAILDGCPHLQSLDVRACFHLDLEGNLGERLTKQVKNLLRPSDLTEDYFYPIEDEDEDYGFGLCSRDTDFYEYYSDYDS
ncbi:hypothetical protein RND81_07G165400 [Saponaria officinalis]|uniref:F-box domain-containing protein n=1 Tax=Saponaria officinalis TaxID=3572 RepID=A0AAW1JSZ9_SAPOF